VTEVDYQLCVQVTVGFWEIETTEMIQTASFELSSIAFSASTRQSLYGVSPTVHHFFSFFLTLASPPKSDSGFSYHLEFSRLNSHFGLFEFRLCRFLPQQSIYLSKICLQPAEVKKIPRPHLSLFFCNFSPEFSRLKLTFF